MKQKGNKKSRKLSKQAQTIAKQIAAENALFNTLSYCLERKVLCRVLLQGEKWTQNRVWMILQASREFVFVLRATDFQYTGYELHRLTDLADVLPAPELTEHYRLLDILPPENVPELNLESLPEALQTVAAKENLVMVAHIGPDEDTSVVVCGHFEKLGKKKLSIRELDPNDLAWSPEPIKLSYEHLDVLCFGTPALLALAQLAMPYDAYIRSVNESVTVPQNMEDFEVGTDLMEGENEDLFDIDELMGTEDNSLPENSNSEEQET